MNPIWDSIRGFWQAEQDGDAMLMAQALRNIEFWRDLDRLSRYRLEVVRQ